MSVDHILLRVGPEVETLADLDMPEPLGSREEVIEELLRICPEPVFDDEGWAWAYFGWPENDSADPGDAPDHCWVTVPDEDPVMAVTVSRMSDTFIARLAERRDIHGWRLFEMGSGDEEILG